MAQYVEGFEPLETPAQQGGYTPGFEPQSAPQASVRGPSETDAIPTLDEAYGNVVRPVTNAVSWAARNNPMVPLMQAGMNGPLKNLLSWLSNGAITGAPTDNQVYRAGETTAKAIVPQTPTAAGATLGSLATGGLGVIPRILGPVMGAGVGSAASGNDLSQVGQDAVLAGAGTAGAEGLSATISKLLRSIPNNPVIGGKANIANDDAARYGQQMGDMSPALAGARTSEDLRQIASAGPRLLGDAKERVIQGMEQMPSSSSVHRVFNQTTVGNTPLPMPSLGRPMSLREANDELSAIGARAFNKDPLMRNFNGIDQRRLYGQVATDIEQGLRAINPTAADMFQQVQGETARGMTAIKPLQSTTAFRNDSGGVQFNTPEVQKFLSSPRGEAMLRNKLGDENYERLRASLLRGGAPGSQDRLTPSPGGFTDAASSIMRSGGGFGTTALLPVRSFLPNLGSSYAGRAPYTLPRPLQTFSDIVSQQLLSNQSR